MLSTAVKTQTKNSEQNLPSALQISIIIVILFYETYYLILWTELLWIWRL
jgi:hypothetical protein